MKHYTYTALLLITTIVAILIIVGNRSIHEINVADYVVKGQVINVSTKNVTKIGVSTDTDKLDFGRMIFNKTNATKLITITNPLRYPIILKFNIIGNISPMLYYHHEYVIRPNESRNIPIKFVPKSLGNFTGTLKIRAIYFSNVLGKKIYEIKKIMKVIE